MHKYVNNLVSIATPPRNHGILDLDLLWTSIENNLGTKLPTDYKDFACTYGPGCFNDFFTILHPILNPDGTASETFTLYLDSYIKLENNRRIFPIYPEPGGLLPVGVDSGGGVTFWVTKGPPESWTLIQYDGDSHQQHNTGIIDFVVSWLTGRSTDAFFGVGPDVLNKTSPIFIPEPNI